MVGTIDTDDIKAYFVNAKDWLVNFFQTMDQNETIAVVGIGLGFVMVIAGIILL